MTRCLLPNLVLLVLDTTGARHLSLYGYPRSTTPNLERLARECRVYRRCFAPGCWTVPSHASMFTGLYPSQHGACEGSFLLGDNVQHLTSAVKMAGYRTVGISCNGLVSPATGLCGDFDEFYDFGEEDLVRFVGAPDRQGAGGREDLRKRLKQAVNLWESAAIGLKYLQETGGLRPLAGTFWTLLKRLLRETLRPSPLVKSSGYSEKTVTLVRRLLADFAREPQRPFFLFINLMEAHQAYRPPLKWRRFSRWRNRAWVDPQRFYLRAPGPDTDRILETYRNLYDDEIRYQDDVVSRLWQALQASPGWENTAVIITADHGEHLGEKGHFTHILSLYNELLWVPLLIRYPRGLEQTGWDERLVSLNDIYPTVLDLLGSPLPRPHTCYSLLEEPQREIALAQLIYPEMNHWQLQARQSGSRRTGGSFSAPRFAVFLANGLKIIERQDGELEIYDLQASMAEEEDLRPRLAPEAVARFKEMVGVLQQETGFWERRREILLKQGFREGTRAPEVAACAASMAA